VEQGMACLTALLSWHELNLVCVNGVWPQLETALTLVECDREQDDLKMRSSRSHYTILAGGACGRCEFSEL
jgi:hypothetical protein